MQQFANLYREIEESTKTTHKLSALVKYLSEADKEDRLWTIALFTHRRPRRTIQTSFLRLWAAELSQLPEWLFEESYHSVGDLAETISLVVPKATEQSSRTLSQWINQIILQKEKTESEKKSFIVNAWNQLSKDERFLFNKLITGGFRIGISQKMMTKAVAKLIGEEENKVAHRLMGNWSPLDTTYEDLLIDTDWKNDRSKPYPFYLAYALEGAPQDLGDVSQWSAEWKWDGIRSQFIKREGELFLWSRGEELVTDKYPEFHKLGESSVDNYVIDGELIVFKDGVVRPFNEMQKRIGRKKPGKKTLTDYPCAIFAYDLLELDGEDLRQMPFHERRDKLETLIQKINNDTPGLLYYSSSIEFDSWDKLIEIRKEARSKRAEGLMLKNLSSIYNIGRKKGGWWKWKLDPFTIDAVMLYAQKGHGRRANLYTDFTFAVWKEDGTLVPFTKAYSGLTDVAFAEITKFVNKNTIERFGPVRSVKPELVFELAFEGIHLSTRHKSGIALRFPRMKRWRKDKPVEEANTLADLKQLLASHSQDQ